MNRPLQRRAFLGAILPADAEAFRGGVMWIDDVVEASMAARAGIAGGDRVRSIAGHPVGSLAELAVALRAAGARDRAEIVFERGDAHMSSTVDVIACGVESIDGATVEYAAIDVAGARLRLIATRSPEARAVIATIQGIACESVDHDGAFGGAISGWTRAGFDTLRFDKRGIGDSEGGPCCDADFATELDDARRTLVEARDDAHRRDLPFVVFGHSVGGIIAAVLAAELEPDAVVVYGAPVMRWIECLRDSTRRQLALNGAGPQEIHARLAALDELAVRGELNGRSAAYHAQLDQVDIASAWRAVTAPVLVVRGEFDWVVDDGDQARIATLARGETTIVDAPGIDHLFGAHADRAASLRNYGAGEPSRALEEATVPWLLRFRSSR